MKQLFIILVLLSSMIVNVEDDTNTEKEETEEYPLEYMREKIICQLDDSCEVDIKEGKLIKDQK